MRPVMPENGLSGRAAEAKAAWPRAPGSPLSSAPAWRCCAASDARKYCSALRFLPALR